MHLVVQTVYDFLRYQQVSEMVNTVETKKLAFEWLMPKQDECFRQQKTQQDAKFKNYKQKYM